MPKDAAIALLLSTLAGLSTGIGGLLVIVVRKFDQRLLAIALGFSAGIMVTVSLADMLPHGAETFIALFGHVRGTIYMVAMIIIGIALSAATDKMVPEPSGRTAVRGAGLHRLGVVTALAICVHNFPEGIATFMSSYADLQFGIPLTISVALHNIPEGMSVAMPIYYATGSRAKAMGYALLSGLSEPLGAVLTYLFLRPFMNDMLLAAMFGVIVGLMCYIAFDELIPSSLGLGRPSMTAAGVLGGIVVMSFSIFIMT